MRDALMRLLEPPIEALGYELVDLEFAQAGRGGVLRVFIDRRAGNREGPSEGEGGGQGNAGGITVDDCARVSHEVGQVLEAEDPIKGHYSLEVSSPGFDRILRKRAHFERFVGARVQVELKLPQAGRRRFAGSLKSVSDDAIVLDVDGHEQHLPLERIQKARLKPE